jgi:hypothetical protein
MWRPRLLAPEEARCRGKKEMPFPGDGTAVTRGKGEEEKGGDDTMVPPVIEIAPVKG